MITAPPQVLIIEDDQRRCAIYVDHILQKLGVSNRAVAVAAALKAGRVRS